MSKPRITDEVITTVLTKYVTDSLEGADRKTDKMVEALKDIRDARAEAAKYKTALEEIKDSHADRGDITWLTANEALIE